MEIADSHLVRTIEPVDLVIFDLDGTLVDSAGDLLQSINYVRQTYDYPPLSRATLHSYIGDGVQELVARALPQLSAARLTEAVAQFISTYDEHLLDTTALFPRMRETLDSLQGRILAVVTNKTELFARKILAGVGVDSYFRVCIGGDSGIDRKPSPAALQAVMAQCGIPAATTIMVGDGVNDLRAAAAAGVRCIAVAYGYTSEHELSLYHPAAIIHEPYKLVSCIV
jgi:phosphoglycolate phosphatase